MNTPKDFKHLTNDSIDENSEDAMSRLREHLGQDPGPEVKKRLQQMRNDAVDSLGKRSLFSMPNLLPALGLSVALALGVGIAWNSFQYIPTDKPSVFTVENEDLDFDELIFLAENDINDEDFQILLESDENSNLDFLNWAGEQPEFL